jgi:hypothetical protein
LSHFVKVFSICRPERLFTSNTGKRFIKAKKTKKGIGAEYLQRIVNRCIVTWPLTVIDRVAGAGEVTNDKLVFGKSCVKQRFKVAEQVHSFGERAANDRHSFVRD